MEKIALLVALFVISVHALSSVRGYIRKSHKFLLYSVYLLSGLGIALESYWLLVISVFFTLFTMGRFLSFLKKTATRDFLTGAFTRHFLYKEWLPKMRKAGPSDQAITLVMVDIDGFKKFNDTYGHLAGDERLKEVASVLRSSVRKNDIVVRYGGDEFLLILNTDEEDAKKVMKRIEEKLRKRDITISYGLKRWIPSEVLESALKLADSRMYGMKQSKKIRNK
ncbi:GGDEF domain-containing protein [Thermotoga sp.]|uniref:GGDEF domain-containing protein n=1 Tax=Thermotoga sp. TaxID=28240 RepID=UPI0025E3BE53|nr:GGDEF domain-containing protein [Thermotoga sp.]MCD6552218.1 GGDEF domain-containing protein [Thermotoga sp.]